MITILVQATGNVVEHREDWVEHRDRQAPPEVSQAKRYAGHEQVNQHQYTVAHVHHNIQRIYLIDLRIVHGEPIAHRHADCHASRDNVQEPIRPLDEAKFHTAGIEIRCLLRLPSP